MNDLYYEILEDARALVQRLAHPKKHTIDVSPEAAALLEQIDGSLGLPPQGDPEPAAEPPQAQSEPAPAAVAEAAQQESAPAPPASAEGPPADASDRVAALKALEEQVSGCVKCPLCESRTQTVFGVGNPFADLVFVGEAPGYYEDQKGEPFVGKAGQLLTDIIVKGIKIRREDVYICNVLKCRPPQNRDPNPEEKRQCEPYLLQQLELLQPKCICALGRHAAQTLLRSNESIGRLRNRWHNYHGIPLRVTYHPAYLLRNAEDKGKCWKDIQEVMKVLNGEVTPELPPVPAEQKPL